MPAVLHTYIYDLNNKYITDYTRLKSIVASDQPFGSYYRHIPNMLNDDLQGLDLNWMGKSKEEFQTAINNALTIIDDISISPPYQRGGVIALNRGVIGNRPSYIAEYIPSIDLFIVQLFRSFTSTTYDDVYFITQNNSIRTSYRTIQNGLVNKQLFFKQSTTYGLGYELAFRGDTYGETGPTIMKFDTGTPENINEILTLIYNCHDEDPYYSTTLIDAEPIIIRDNYYIEANNEFVKTDTIGTISFPRTSHETDRTYQINANDTGLPEGLTGPIIIYSYTSGRQYNNHNLIDVNETVNVKIGNILIKQVASGSPNYLIYDNKYYLQRESTDKTYITIYPYRLEHYIFARWHTVSDSYDSYFRYNASTVPSSILNYIDIKPSSSGYNVNITSSPEEGGQTTGGGSYDAGSPVQITSTANNGYVFKGWWVELNGVSSLLSNDKEFVIPSLNSDMNITAVFKKDTNPPEDQGGISGPGGGNGSYEPTVNVTPIPDLPLSPASSGLYNIYTLTQEQLGQFSSFLHGSLLTDSSFETLLNDILKWGGDVSTAIIRSGIIPINPVGVSDTIHLSNGVDTLVPATRITSQVQRKDMGTIEVKPYWNSALDYSPYTKAEIYLPFIGSRPIDPDLIMGKALSVSYIMDILSGNCVAYITAGDNVLYQFNGNILTALPITGKTDNIGSFITSAVSTAIGIGTANPIMATAGVAGTVATSKPNITRTGDMSCNVGRLGIHVPVLYLTRLKQNLPAGYNKINGYPSNISARLGSLTGYTKISSIHVDGIPASREELDEIEMMLKGGVIL